VLDTNGLRFQLLHSALLLDDQDEMLKSAIQTKVAFYIFLLYLFGRLRFEKTTFNW
jgi:hypothetical protein